MIKYSRIFNEEEIVFLLQTFAFCLEGVLSDHHIAQAILVPVPSERLWEVTRRLRCKKTQNKSLLYYRKKSIANMDQIIYFGRCKLCIEKT